MQADSNFQQYVSAHLERLTVALHHARTELTRLDQHHTAITNTQKRQDDIEMKIRLMEVYHVENYRNNERLYGAQDKVETIQRRLTMIEEKQAYWEYERQRDDSRDRQSEGKVVMEEIKGLVKRLEEVEGELERNRQKTQLLNRFKRDPPRIINTESTKDISTELTNDKQLRKIEKKLQDFITEKVKIIEGKYVGAVGEDWERALEKHREQMAMKERKQGKHKQSLDGQQEYWPRSSKATMSTAVKRENQQQPGHHFRNKIDTYYTQPTEKEQLDHLQQVKKDKKTEQSTSNPKKKTKSKSKSKSKEKKPKTISIKSPSKQDFNLSSVNEYLRLRGKKE